MQLVVPLHSLVGLSLEEMIVLVMVCKQICRYSSLLLIAHDHLCNVNPCMLQCCRVDQRREPFCWGWGMVCLYSVL